MKKTILAITAHPDDHTTFAGTIMKLQSQGYDYYELVLTDGCEGDDYKKGQNNGKLTIAEIRQKELIEASEFLKTKKLFHFTEEDQNLNYSKDLMQKVVEVIREVKPDIGITMNTNDVHTDHIAASELAKEAFRWAAKKYRTELGSPHRTNVVLFAEGVLPINAQLLVDVTDFYTKKEQLYKIYKSQASPKDIDLMRSFALIRGYHLRKGDSKFGEAFSVEQNILPILFE